MVKYKFGTLDLALRSRPEIIFELKYNYSEDPNAVLSNTGTIWIWTITSLVFKWDSTIWIAHNLVIIQITIPIADNLVCFSDHHICNYL